MRDTAEAPAAQALWRQIELPYKLASLSLQKPDSSIGMPVAGVRIRSVANTWHAPRSGRRQHEGQDIFAPRWTPVVAATEGIVTRVGGGRLGGNAVFVTGRGGRTYYYAHLQEYAKEFVPGDLIGKGEVVGYVGTSGNARGTPPHLHFGVYTPAGAVDPLDLIESAL